MDSIPLRDMRSPHTAGDISSDPFRDPPPSSWGEVPPRRTGWFGTFLPVSPRPDSSKPEFRTFLSSWDFRLRAIVATAALIWISVDLYYCTHTHLPGYRLGGIFFDGSREPDRWRVPVYHVMFVIFCLLAGTCQYTSRWRSRIQDVRKRWTVTFMSLLGMFIFVWPMIAMFSVHIFHMPPLGAVRIDSANQCAKDGYGGAVTLADRLGQLWFTSPTGDEMRLQRYPSFDESLKIVLVKEEADHETDANKVHKIKMSFKPHTGSSETGNLDYSVNIRLQNPTQENEDRTLNANGTFIGGLFSDLTPPLRYVDHKDKASFVENFGRQQMVLKRTGREVRMHKWCTKWSWEEVTENPQKLIDTLVPPTWHMLRKDFQL